MTEETVTPVVVSTALEQLIEGYLVRGKNGTLQMVLCGGPCCKAKWVSLDAAIAAARAEQRYLVGELNPYMGPAVAHV